jgi:hypothetical protein
MFGRKAHGDKINASQLNTWSIMSLEAGSLIQRLPSPLTTLHLAPPWSRCRAVPWTVYLRVMVIGNYRRHVIDLQTDISEVREGT